MNKKINIDIVKNFNFEDLEEGEIFCALGIGNIPQPYIKLDQTLSTDNTLLEVSDSNGIGYLANAVSLESGMPVYVTNEADIIRVSSTIDIKTYAEGER